MNYSFFIALKHLFGRRKHIFGYITTFFSMAGIMLGVASLIVVLSVMNGFQKDVKERIVDVNAHIVVLKFFNDPIKQEEADRIVDSVKSVNGVLNAVKFIYSKGIVQSKNFTDGVVIRGFDQNDSASTKALKKNIIFGEIPSKENEILLGVDLSQNLRAHSGDTVYIATLFNSSERMNIVIPRINTFIVSGIFDAGLYQYNAELVYIPLNKASELFGLKGDVSGVEVRIDKIYDAPSIASKIEKKLGYPYRTNNWIELNSALFTALTLEKKLMFILLLLVIIVAAFNIITTLIMIVMEKTTEIGILKTLGLNNNDIRKIFIYQGIIINVIGTILGISAGLILCYFLSKYQFIDIPGNVYLLNKLPVQVRFTDVLLTIIVSNALSFIASLYPAIRASKMNPVEAIRYE